MLKLEELAKDAPASGLFPNEIVRLVNIDEAGANARLVAYRNAAGKLNEQTIFRSDEHRLSLAESSALGPSLPTRPHSNLALKPTASVWLTC